MRVVHLLLAALAASALACASGEPNQPSPADDGGTPIPDAGGPLLDPHTITVGPIRVESGEEATQCVVKRVGNTGQLRVGKIHSVLSPGSHTLIVYRSTATVEEPTPFPCEPFVGTLEQSDGSPLVITQRADETIALPQGVAFSLAADALVRLELHYVNNSASPIEVSASTTLLPIPPGEFEHEADLLFIGSPDISLPVHTVTSLGPVFFPLPTDLADSKFFAVTGRTHKLGTHVRVETVDSPSGEGTPVYDVDGWSPADPATVYADPPFTIAPGGGFRFTCDWNNTSELPVGFGAGAGQEMCFLGTYYYPSRGAFICFHTAQAGGLDLCCPGNSLCSQVF